MVRRAAAILVVVALATLGSAAGAEGAPAAPVEAAPPRSTPTPTPGAAPAPRADAPAPGPPPADDEAPLELVGPDPADEPIEDPTGEQPVAHVEGQVTVSGAKRKRRKPEPGTVAGEVATEEDKKWLAEVCPPGPKGAGSWLDRSQDKLNWSVCRATLWFDGLFGNPRAIEERDATYGYVQPGVRWQQHEGIDPELRFRAKINLPLADRRFNALLGRADGDDRPGRASPGGGSDPLPPSFRDEEDQWLVGLGYSPVRGARRRIDLDAGVELKSPAEVFVRGRYRRHWFLSEQNLVRMRETNFWRSDDGFGVGLRFDFERVLEGPFVLRWRSDGSFAQHTRGVEWYEELTLFERLNEKSAIAYVLDADGKTDGPFGVRKYGLEVIYRRKILREWLYVELRPGLDWRRREREDGRKLEPILGVGLQVHFGDDRFE